MNKPTYAFDEEGYFHNDAQFFIGRADEFLVGVLNSPCAWWFLTQTCTDLQNGYLQALLANQEPIPIPNVDAAQREVVKSAVRVAIFLARQSDKALSHPRDPLMRDYYEELLNALVYELYLPEDLHAAGLQFFDLITAAKIPDLAAKPKADAKEKLNLLREKFEELYAPSHPLRAALQKLHTLDPIRIIEGKA
jgi:hypothetical protein